MKRTIAILIALFAVIAVIQAQTTVALPNLVPHDARSMGTGGAFSAVTWGYDSFYGNPAGFASGRAQLTLADASVWAYVKPTEANIASVQDLASGTPDVGAFAGLASSLLTENGLGAGLSFGLGYAGRGLGIGAFVVGDAVASGQTILGAKLQSSVNASAVIGLGVPLNFGDFMSLRLGADVRPSVRLEAANGGWAFASLLGALTGSSTPGGASITDQLVVAGFGIALDAGAQLSLGSLSFGLAIRDIMPNFPMMTESLADLQANPNLQFDANSATATAIPSVTAGVAWRPVFIKGILEPGVYFEVQDPVSVIKDKESVWNLLHAGADLKLLSMVTLRGGINRGWLSAGVGLNLFLVEINAAVFTEELGSHPGDFGRTGVSVQADIHL
jgi:hypothetical protein